LLLGQSGEALRDAAQAFQDRAEDLADDPGREPVAAAERRDGVAERLHEGGEPFGGGGWSVGHASLLA
jgi:hypothetical protein